MLTGNTSVSESSDTIRILHVDDDRNFAKVSATYLEREDDSFHVETATSVGEGLSLLDEGTFHCIVSDYEMPGRDGIAFLEAVRETDSDIPFILYTGKGSEEVASEAISAGVTDYLQKEASSSQYTVLANRIHNAVAVRRSHRTARERKRRLETLIDNLPGVVYQCRNEPEWPLQSIEGDCEELTGYPKTALERHEVTFGEDIIHPDDRQQVWDRVQKALNAGESYEHTFRISTADGTTKWLWEHGQGVHSDSGELIALEGFFTDVTDRIRQQQALEKIERRLALALEKAEAGLWEWNVDTGDLYWSEELLALLGISPDEFNGSIEAFRSRLHPSDVEQVEDAIDEALETGGTYQIEQRLQDAEGNYVWFEIRGQVVTDDGSTIMVGIGIDITARKEQERRYQAIFNQTYQFTGLLEPDGTLIEANDSALEFGGIDRETVIGTKLWETPWFTHSETTKETAREAVSRAADGEFFRREVPVQGSDREAIIDFSIRPVTDDQGTVQLLIPEGRDITDLKKKEQALQNERDRLDEFASIVSHDLRNPLNVAQLRVDLAQNECDSDHLDHAVRAQGRMMALIDDLLLLARSGDHLGEVEMVELAATVESCWENIATEQAASQIAIDRVIEANRSRLHQLFENLMRNAVEHGGRDVTVTVGELDDGFYVEDTGPGISAVDREAVFDSGYSTNEKGTGFGLSIVKQITEAHGWSISLTDGQDGGARFEITGVTFAPGEK